MATFKYKYLQLNTKTAIVFSLVLWIYLIIRALRVPFLHDEISTFWFYINNGDFIPFAFKMDTESANNHLLNSFLSHFIYKIFGYTPFILRLANLLFVTVYCFFAYKIADTLKNKYLALLFWVCLLFIHSIVEFLALSRGYGMSFALLLGSLWYVSKAIKSDYTLDYFLALLLLVFSVSANLSLLITALIIIGILGINTLLSKTNSHDKLVRLSIICIAGILPIVFFVLYSFALRKSGALYYGQPDSFWQQSVSTIVKALFGSQALALRLVIAFYFILTMILFGILVVRNFSLSIFHQAVIVFPLLFVGNICAVLVLNYFFKVNFPEDRTGFHLYYFFIGSIFFLIDKIAENPHFNKIAWFAIPLVLIPVHFVFASNLTYVSVYKEDRIPNRFYTEIAKKSETMPQMPTLGSYRGRTLVLAFQNYLNGGNVGKSHDSDYPSLIPDFQVVKTDEFAPWSTYYNAIDYDEVSGYHLLERKHKMQRHTIYEKQAISTNGEISDEYFNLAEGTLDSLTQNPLYFEYTMDIESKVAPFEAWIVVNTTDSAGKTTAYEYIPLNWIKPSWMGESKHYRNGQLVTNLKSTSTKYVTYIWNIKKVPYSISNAKVAIKKLDEQHR